jgi:hypothetical protein
MHGFAGPAPDTAAPRCASWEVDRAQFVPIDRARDMMHPATAPFLDLPEEMFIVSGGAAPTRTR